MKTNTKFFFLFVALVVVDQFAKNISAVSICNKNLAWSIPIAPAIFYFAWIAIISVLIYIFLQTKSISQKFILALVFSGSISNIIDRIRLGCVVDYIDIKIWPVFNLADIYITIGVILFLFSILGSKSKKN